LIFRLGFRQSTLGEQKSSDSLKRWNALALANGRTFIASVTGTTKFPYIAHSDVVHPAKTVGALLWPFDGSLSALSESRRLVICETYPAEAYGQIGLRFPPGASKRRQSDRRGAAPVLFGWASRNGVSFSGGMRNTIVEGFGSGASGEDQFDAALGLFGMIEVVDGRRPAAPESIGAINCEGWILGQAA